MAQNKKNRNAKRTEEPDLNARKLRWIVPLPPLHFFLTILAICFLGFSLSYYSAWLLGYQWTTALIYIGSFFLTIMILLDITAIRDYMIRRRKEKDNS